MVNGRKRRFFLLLSYLLVNTCCFALQRQLSFTHLDIGDGLIHNQVNCITKDTKGFVWLGTPSGLSRYDGKHFISFRHNNADSSSLSDNYVEKIFNLPAGRLWIKSSNSSDIFDPRKMQFSRNEQAYLKSLGLPGGEIIQIHQISLSSYLFVYKNKGIAIYDRPSLISPLPKILWFAATNPFLNADAIIDASGRLWVISQLGQLFSYDSASGQWNNGPSLFNPKKVKSEMLRQTDTYRLFADSKGRLWIYTAGLPGPLYCLQPGASSLIAYRADKPLEGSAATLNNNIIHAITEDETGHIWVGTDHGGINIIDPDKGTIRYLMNNAENQKSLAQNCIYDLYEDDNGLIWVGTYKKGICYYNQRMDRFPLFSHDPNAAAAKSTLPFEDVNRFVEDELGNLWIGTNGGGLIYYNRGDSTYKRFTHNVNDPSSLCADVIVGLCFDAHGRLWIGTYYGGLDCYQNGRFTHYRHQPGNPSSLSDDRVWDVIEDKNNDKCIWVATLGGGLQRLDPDTGIFTTYPPSNSNIEGIEFVLTMDQLNNGDLWVGTAAGIDIYPGGKTPARHLGNIAGNARTLSNDNINVIYEDHKGYIWVGTREGLNCVDPSSGIVRRYTTKDGLPDNTVLTILEDKNGYLWMSTPSGLIRFDPPAVFMDSINPAVFRKFDESDGLQGREFNEKSAFKTWSGSLIFGGAGGFNLFNPDSISIDYYTPPIVFTELQIGGKTAQITEKYSGRAILHQSISWTKTLTLPYGASDFSLSFMALGYGQSSKIKYAYRLKGFNEQWILIEHNADNRATYTNLDPGDYTLEVRSSNQDGIWNKTPATMQLSILPPFWKTTWAYLIYGLLLAGLLYLARSILLYRARMRFELEQQKRQASHTHDMDTLKIRFLTNISHEFRTPLSLILAPLDKIIKEIQDPGLNSQLDMVRRNAKRLLHLVSQLLDFRKLEVQEIRLQPVQGDIISFVNYTAISFTDIAEKKNIDFIINSTVASLTASYDPDKLERILFNLLSNAFKFTPEKGQINLDITEQTEANRDSHAHWLKISIQDNGIGIPTDKLRQIFERFFQHELPYQMVNAGSGIGLSITQEFVRLHGGRIEATSIEGKGSCFAVWLPVTPEQDLSIEGTGVSPDNMHRAKIEANALAQSKSKQAPNKDPIHITALKAEGRQIDVHKKAKPNGRKKTILLVEDHEDFRFYLKDNLGIQFNILEASDGMKGWECCLKEKPDLVVSDIMMEGMDGLQLCRKIKKDPRTAAIPVILLTAKATEQQQVEGLNQGANDYMTKPFNFEILQARILNLLQQVKQSNKEAPAKVTIQPAHLEIDSQQEQFLLAAKEAVEKSMEDADFSVEQLSQALFVSRVTLYKKLVNITGKTPIEFIRTLRVKTAAEYLKKGMNVAQAAYEVGYNNPKNFTKHFKQVFGMLPSEYSKEQKLDDLLNSELDTDNES